MHASKSPSAHAASPVTRMDRVQAPIVAVVGDWIRQTPGTISLGQGVVHYGPPTEALDAVRRGLDTPEIHQYHDGHGLPALIERITFKLAHDNGIVVEHGSTVMVTAGANM